MTALLLRLVVAQTAVAPDPGDVAWLADPASAVFWLLGEPPPPAKPEPPAWDGALPAAVLDGLFATYRLVLASQDDSPCGFVPSCSAFSQQAIAELGLGEGLLLTADRLLRDHPLAHGHYPPDAVTGLLQDPPSRYRPGEPR